MTVREAYRKLCSHVKEKPAVMACREYDSRYAFFIAPEGTNTSKDAYVGGSMFCVDKSTGKVHEEEPWKYGMEFWTPVRI